MFSIVVMHFVSFIAQDVKSVACRVIELLKQICVFLGSRIDLSLSRL